MVAVPVGRGRVRQRPVGDDDLPDHPRPHPDEGLFESLDDRTGTDHRPRVVDVLVERPALRSALGLEGPAEVSDRVTGVLKYDAVADPGGVARQLGGARIDVPVRPTLVGADEVVVLLNKLGRVHAAALVSVGSAALRSEGGGRPPAGGEERCRRYRRRHRGLASGEEVRRRRSADAAIAARIVMVKTIEKKSTAASGRLPLLPPPQQGAEENEGTAARRQADRNEGGGEEKEDGER